MKQDRFLTGILIGIALLIVVALTVFFTNRNKPAYGTEDTPGGVVHNYVLALLNKDYPKAYGYLADLENKPSYDLFRHSFGTGVLNLSNTGVKIGQAEVNGDDATVQVITVNAPSDPFGREYDNPGSTQLVRQNGAWKISSMQVYNLWDFNWYQAPPK